MFIPLGFLLPRVFTGLNRFWKVFLSSGGIIVAVELVQLVTLLGTCDVDDLILNLAGTALGYGIHAIISK